VIVTDHKPLLRIFGEKKSLPPLAAARLHRWALFLAQYDYTIRYKSGQAHSNADALSRLPAPPTPDVNDEAEMFYVHQVNSVPALTATQIREKTAHDSLLSRVVERVHAGWGENGCNDPELQVFYSKRDELALQDGVVLWGRRVVVPKSLQGRVLEMLHTAHPGTTRMRQLARIHVWWPNIDAAIEQKTFACDACQENRFDPKKGDVVSWPVPEQPWDRVHIDYAPKFHGRALLILVDAHSKWIEIGITACDNMSSEKTIDMLRGWFNRFGYPRVIVSDNGSNFTSEQFKQFVDSMAVEHKFSAPGHPATNGAAERAVQTVKRALTKILKGPSRDLNKAVEKFLFSYRFTPTSTGVSPSQLFLNRDVRNPFSILSEGKPKCDPLLSIPDPAFALGQQVRFRSLKSNPRWLKGTIVSVEGPCHFRVCDLSGHVYRRHKNQIVAASAR
jgi:transposase InsO family protein